MAGRKCAHVAACTASLGVLGGVCPITSRDSCSYYEPEIDRDALLALADEFESWADECRKHYVETEQQGLIGEASAYLDCAGRIREVVGE